MNSFVGKVLEHKKDILLGGVFLLLWVLPVYFINPQGNFPLNDDWCFSLLVKSLVQEGKLNFTGYPIMTLIGHTLLGTLFCSITGFSFTALRVYGLIVGFLGIITTFSIVKEVQGYKRIAFLSSLVLAFNPIYFSLSYTFMTDIPFFCMSALSCLFFLRTLNTDSKVNYTLAVIFSMIAVSIRQPGIVFPAAFGMVYLLTNKRNKRTVIFALTPFVIVATAFISYEFFIKYELGYPEKSSNSNLDFLILIFSDPGKVMERQAQILMNSLIYMGVFLIPVLLLVSDKKLILIFSHRSSSYVLKIISIFFVGFLMLLILLNLKGKIMPLEGNILFNLGIGPMALHDVVYAASAPFQMNKIFWLWVTFIGIAGGFFIVLYFFRAIIKIKSIRNKNYFLFAFIACILYFPLVTVVGFFDRYLLIPILLFLIMLLSLDYVLIKNKLIWSISIFVIFVSMVFSVLGTKDYLSWNRARWEGLNYLTEEKKIAPEFIDGGYEFNGLYGYQEDKVIGPGKSWWWVDGDEYMLTLHPLPGYTVFRRLPYQRYIPYREEYVYILKKSTHN